MLVESVGACSGSSSCAGGGTSIPKSFSSVPSSGMEELVVLPGSDDGRRGMQLCSLKGGFSLLADGKSHRSVAT